MDDRRPDYQFGQTPRNYQQPMTYSRPQPLPETVQKLFFMQFWPAKIANFPRRPILKSAHFPPSFLPRFPSCPLLCTPLTSYAIL